MSKLLEIQNSISGDFGTLLQPHRRLIREGEDIAHESYVFDVGRVVCLSSCDVGLIDIACLCLCLRRVIGQLMKLSVGLLSKLHLRRVYLFSDILLWITTTSKFRGHMELEGAHISEYAETGKRRYGFKLVTAKKSVRQHTMHRHMCHGLCVIIGYHVTAFG